MLAAALDDGEREPLWETYRTSFRALGDDGRREVRRGWYKDDFWISPLSVWMVM